MSGWWGIEHRCSVTDRVEDLSWDNEDRVVDGAHHPERRWLRCPSCGWRAEIVVQSPRQQRDALTTADFPTLVNRAMRRLYVKFMRDG